MKRPLREYVLTCACIVASVIAAALALGHMAGLGLSLGAHNRAALASLIAFGAIVVLLIYGGLIYQVSRAGYFWRVRHGPPPPNGVLAPARPLTVLIPSYKEEIGVLRLTLLSAVLMEHPNRRIVVLLDDPPTGSPEDMAALEDARGAVRDLQVELSAYAAYFAAAERRFQHRRDAAALDARVEARELAGLYRQAATWIEGRLGAWLGDSAGEPADRFFERQIARRLITEHRARGDQLFAAGIAPAEIDGEYRRLVALFGVELASFERKRFANLAHAPNKAMNLNAYIGLIGGAFREIETEEGVVLAPCAPGEAHFNVPPADYLLTLDADSMVHPDYATKLAAILDANPRIAVAQTPYSAFPGAAGALEQVAGATTDLQYIAHQGSTVASAAYWVGANALLRRRALIEIRRDGAERGHTVPVFIQDRTVIEDTGSTIDLIRRGWTLHNHPERLAYSATPPDFGSLSIQRRRWANGGLIILPDLIGHCLRRGGAGPGEALVRIHYLISPAVANLGLLSLLLIPFSSHFASVWLPLSAAPYYFVYGRDLKQAGYRWRDLVRVYALNLMLLPVNLAGVWDSVRQLLSGRKVGFARTPKVGARTATAPVYVGFQLAAILYLAVAAVADLWSAQWLHATFSAANLGLFVYGFSRFVGWRHSLVDIGAWWRSTRPRAAIAPQWPEAPVTVTVEAEGVDRFRERA